MKYILILTLTLVFNTNTHASNETDQIDAVTSEYMQILNDYRHDLGLEALEYSKVIELSSKGHSKNMARKVVPFGHKGSSRRCHVIQNSLKGGNLCGEIVAWGQKTAQRVFEAWKKSPPHHRAMIQSRYTHTGFGFHKNAEGRIYWTQIFLELK